jgi:hypothetical protein
MNAHNDLKKRPDRNFVARPVLAAARLRFAALVDGLVAGWLERCAANAEAAQRLFEAGHEPASDPGIGVSLYRSIFTLG